MKHFDPKELTNQFIERTNINAFKESQQRHGEETRRRNAEKLKAEQDGQFDDVLTVSLALSENIAVFRRELDDMQQKALERILYLQQQRDALMTEKQTLLDNAFVLDDGQRVFRSNDATYVIDENGDEVSADIINPEQISGEYSNAEDYKSTIGSLENVDKDLGEAITFHERIEDLQERAGQEVLSQAELEALKLELDEITPDSFKPDTLDTKIEPDVKISSSEQNSQIGYGYN
jgi:hypothetical protein